MLKYKKLLMKSYFLKGVKCHSKKWAHNADIKFDHYVLEKSFAHMNKCAYVGSVLSKS